MKIKFNSIRIVINSVENKKDANWGNDVSQLVIDKQYEHDLIWLSAFSHLIVIYYLNKASFNMKKHLIIRPQTREDMPMVGILLTLK
ncbi:hypothetical protein [Clostridium estertheticum]|uniref:hypothetical protein n=1 Tax=Clostridium estertheticum TaxID=238834 RepID=UPI001CF1B0B4|nr:hypothetical protein [Clostridium estertheticum]MCB2358203.1 hypothetical protein [Clostridium estertheticum]